MTSIFQEIETGIETEAAVVITKIEQFWSADAAPILSAVLAYIEQNGASDLLKIAQNVFTAAIAGLETGTSVQNVTAAVIGTVVDEAKSAGIQIAEGAATLAVSLVAAQASQNAAPVVTPPAAA